MGFFSKVFKGIKKVVKKIGKGVKKVFKKVGKVFGKLGIVGQLGLMFLMPYAMGGLSQFWGGFGKFAQGLAGSSNVFVSGVGKAMGYVHSAGSVVGNVFNTVSEAISNGIDRTGNFLQGKGFTLSEGRTPIFGGKEVSQPSVPQEVSDYIKEVSDKVSSVTTKPDDYVIKYPDVVDKPSLIDRGKAYVSSVYEGVKDTVTDPEKVGEQITGGLLSGTKQRVAYAVAGDPPTQKNLVTHFDLNALRSFDTGGVSGQVDFFNMNNAYQNMGSSWGAVNSIGNLYTTDLASGGDETYMYHNRLLRMGN